MPGDNPNEFKNHAWICTASGRRFGLYDTDPSQISLYDIAHALSNQCRFTGHVSSFYSVAQHCVLVSELAQEFTDDAMDLKCALMHDASEAYLSDLAAPFKPEVKGYHEVESIIERRIYERFDLKGKTEIVKCCDWIALFLEAHQLISDDISKWIGYDEWWEKTKEHYRKIDPWVPNVAFQRFMERATQLGIE